MRRFDARPAHRSSRTTPDTARPVFTVCTPHTVGDGVATVEWASDSR
jgi:hypothetical protein